MQIFLRFFDFWRGSKEVNCLEEIVIEVWGDFACFGNPVTKVERLTYPFPTPSAARGILSAIYSKPAEFYWQVNRIEVLNPIRYISFKRNEVKSTLGMKDGVGIPIITEEDRTQRQTVALQDVRYRIAACRIFRITRYFGEVRLYRGDPGRDGLPYSRGRLSGTAVSR